MTARRALPSFWTLQLLGWGAYYLAMAFSRVGRYPLSYMLAEKLLLAVLGLAVSLVLRVILRRLLKSRQPMTTVIGICVVTSYALAAVWTASANVLSIPIEAAFLERSSTYGSLGALLNGTVYNSFTIVAWGFLYLGLSHFLALQLERERALKAETLVAETKLRALQYQLNPHLLFNTLNAISTLVVERRTDDASLMIARLGDFLRATLRQDLAATVPLAEELSFIGQYLEIEQVRFGDRLRVTYDVEEDAYRALVPFLLLQPLVENATRHGIARLDVGGEIAISARVVESELEIAIRNTAPPGAAASETEGIGLANVRQRLAVMYGDRQSLRTSVLPSGQFGVDIRIPFVRQTA